MLLLLAVSGALGLYLVYLSDLVVLFLGLLCFFFGIIYSYGPVPISHGPYGELVSGFFYGLVIPAILFYINVPGGGFFSYTLAGGNLSIVVDLRAATGLLLLSIVPFCLTANIMLANNICDRERDVAVGRYTLAFYLGRKALWLFTALYYIAYLSVVVLVGLGFLSPLSLFLLLSVFPVQRNIKRFWRSSQGRDLYSGGAKLFNGDDFAHRVNLLGRFWSAIVHYVYFGREQIKGLRLKRLTCLSWWCFLPWDSWRVAEGEARKGEDRPGVIRR